MSKKSKARARSDPASVAVPVAGADYLHLLSDVSALLDQSRRMAARSVNAVLTATYWQIGRRIVEHEQGGKIRVEYGEEILNRLSGDLIGRFGRGYSARNLWQMRAFYLGWEIWQTPSAKFEARVICPTLADTSTSGKCQTSSGISGIAQTPSAQFEARQ